MIDALVFVLQPVSLMWISIGSGVGLVIGILPGLGGVFALSLMLPLIFALSDAMGLVFLGAVFFAIAYGGSVSAILLGVPGASASVATIFDGYPLSRQGRAKFALGASMMSSLVGSLLGLAALFTVAPVIALYAARVDSASYFMLAMLGLSFVAIASKQNVIRGLIMGYIGLMLSFIGRDIITTELRFTLGSFNLENGLGFIPVTIGLYAISQALVLMEQNSVVAKGGQMGDTLWSGIKVALRYPRILLRSSVIGLIIGAIPGAGSNIAALVTYTTEKFTHKNQSTFGKGDIRGVVAPESANNACVFGELIPTFALGIPGGPPAAILLVAATILGLQAGPAFFSDSARTWFLFWGFLIGQVTWIVWGLILLPFYARITTMPAPLLAPMVLALATMGSFVTNYAFFDVLVAYGFGVVGYYCIKYRWPAEALLLGLVLGNIAEVNFRRALVISKGSYGVFLEPLPLSIMLISIAAIVLSLTDTSALLQRLGWRGRLGRRTVREHDESKE